ncbi:MAG: ATP-binding protein [Planctomycetes bacterium]|nr:ATP-binding protein [Planctomycetota bacterium]
MISQRGAGLGLAIAREIARRHHGEITVASSRQNGTMFCFILPLFKGNH